MRNRAFLLVVALCVLTAAIEIQAQPGGGFVGGPGGFGGGTGERIEPKDLTFELGVAEIPDRASFEKISYQGPDVMRDGYLANLEFVKFIIENAQADNVNVYFMNTENFRAHPHFMGAVGIRGGFGRGRRGASEAEEAKPGKIMRGALTYLPRLKAPDGSAGLYTMDFQPNDSYSFEEIKYARDTLTGKMPLLKGKTAFHPLAGNMRKYESEKATYAASDVAVHLDEDIYGDIAYLPLNIAESFGRLRVMGNDARPSPREIVICKTLPNQMPRVAGVISEVRQTPLSHVNLRAIQDKVPNAYITSAMQDKTIASLVGKLVHYQVTQQGYKIREASQAEVDAHFDKLRPSSPQSPPRDLSKTKITPLSEIQFADGTSFGVKTANLATMHTFEFPNGTVPDGFGVPFYFYDDFMKRNGLYKVVDQMLSDTEFQTNRDVQTKRLNELRSLIKKGKLSDSQMAELTKIQDSFGAGVSIRCRSSTNNEDLPGFSGAGLYDSFTHHATEGHLSKSIKQVFASLWNFRAFEEREFYRIDHKLAAMGVLLHPNFSDEKANGVAVTDDILYETEGNYYVNIQLGEDLVTNPDEDSSPEEILLGWWKRDGHEVVRHSDQIPEDGQMLKNEQLEDLRSRLARIHGRFRKLYEKSEDEEFAMEIEFKITNDGKLAIKQARPWVF